MDKDVSAGSGITTIAGRLALGVTLLAFGLGYTDLIDGVTAADAVSIAHYVGGVALFVAGLFALRDRDTATGTAHTVLGAFWFTWAVSAGAQVSDNAAGLFLLLFALVALSLTLAGGDQLGQGAYGLFCVALVLMAVARFAVDPDVAGARSVAAVPEVVSPPVGVDDVASEFLRALAACF